jgi:hypothetical protein
MAEYKILSHDEQVELVKNAKTRMDAVASAWLQNPKIKSAVLKPKEDDCDHRQAS